MTHSLLVNSFSTTLRQKKILFVAVHTKTFNTEIALAIIQEQECFFPWSFYISLSLEPILGIIMNGGKN